MSDCPSPRDLNALVDGDLASEAELAIRQHLDLCAACCRAVAGVTALKRAVGRAQVGELPSPALRRAVTASLPKRRRRWWWAGAVAAPLLFDSGAVLFGLIHLPPL